MASKKAPAKMTGEFLTRQAEAPVQAVAVKRVNKDGQQIKNLTVTLTQSQWLNVLQVTATEGTKIKPYILRLIAEDFERRGLRF